VVERLIIVVPSLANPRLPYPTGIYIPSHTEWMLFLGGVRFYPRVHDVRALLPVISVWEIQEGRQESSKTVTERITSYMPDRSSHWRRNEQGAENEGSRRKTSDILIHGKRKMTRN